MCGKNIAKNTKMCRSCYDAKNKKPSKEKLDKLLWEKPTIHIAKDYGVSDKTIEKWSKAYGLTKPPRGYWSKKSAQ